MRFARSLTVPALVAVLLLSACGGGSEGSSGSSGGSGGAASTGGTGASGVQGVSAGTGAPGGLGASGLGASGGTGEAPIPAEDSPPGDIPDDIAFVPFTSKAGGFTISTPEGWARTSTDSSVTFTDKLNTIVVSWQVAAQAPTVKSVQADEVPALQTAERAFLLGSVSEATLPAGPAVLTTYQANSEPNNVTGKQYRLDVQRYSLFQGGTEVVIGLRSPVGADNVDPWRIVTESFTWS